MIAPRPLQAEADDDLKGPRLLLVADDLMFPSRVREGAKPLNARVVVVATESAILEKLSAETFDAVLVNLTARRYDPIALIRRLKTDTMDVPVLAFAGHVEKDKHDAAREAGADLVAANSSVALHLPALLSRLLALSQPTNVEADDAPAH